ncbi:rhodanese-like domain-containing protein [Ulvibacter litoralis]|uniref:Rhodanese-related sulfurtransferase n=1 Tax=Ulvibacter litoralis TaxID=227084 RepID=A0A1G7J104_9FLAO|nr:rhodanese-like domain-containing protein [Ulvibacter litoralis]GHC60455.1 rhodanese-like domain-containing protein [Ulvibacter litoralis]SDF18571.1 Rhodanese-related sulfurtransferase [Ulvibacter litoralis]
MKKIFFLVLVGVSLTFLGCKNKETSSVMKVVTPQEVYDAVYNSNDSSAQLVDVRTQEEYGVSHLKDAQNICVTTSDFQEKVKTLDKNKPVYLYCKRGGRSAKAAKILTDLGFTKVYDLQGGITNWEDKGMETEK